MKTSVLLLYGLLEKADSEGTRRALLIRGSLNSQITFFKTAAPKSIHHLDQSMLTAPECDQYGQFKPIQCTHQHCCCVDPRTGRPVKNTTTSKSQMANLFCNYSFPSNCTAYTFNCTKCQKTFNCVESDCHTHSPPLCLQYETVMDLPQPSTPPVPVKKPGSCPPAPTNLFSWYNRFSCTKRCRTDGDCGGDTKCCFNGCSSECKQPVHATASVSTENSCCSISQGFRKRCSYYNEDSCKIGGCCWDGSRRECFRSSCPTNPIIKTVSRPHLTASWFLWSGWSDCNCGQKRQSAFRACKNGRPGQGKCIGPATRSKECEIDEIEAACGASWGSWSSWSTPTVSCGPGVVSRSRQCTTTNVNCRGESVETKVTHHDRPCPSWSQWSLWQECSVTCGLGTTSRARLCIKGAEDGECEAADAIETKDCKADQECPVWLDWSEWASCSVTCGLGTASRSRACSIDGACIDGKPTETKVCIPGECPTWREWTEWSSCSQSCGHGVKVRQRQCSVEHGCEGDHNETDECYVEPCPYWTIWSDWSTCSITDYCQVGLSTRERICVQGRCVGEKTDEKACTSPCGQLTDWSGWTNCSAKCDGGEQSRNRYCVDNNIVVDRALCLDADLLETKTCATDKCATWTQWTAWTLHPTQWRLVRNRKCVNVGQYAATCPGPNTEETFCVKTLCPFFGEWSEWEVIGESRSRERECLNGELEQPGCQGAAKETEQCAKSCSNYEQWSAWKSINATVFERTRSCDDANIVAQINNPCRLELTDSVTRQCIDGNCATWGEWGEWFDQGDRQRRRLRSCDGGRIGDPGCTDADEVETEETTPWTPWIFNQPKEELERERSVCHETGCRFPSRQRQTRDCRTFDQCPQWTQWQPWVATLAGPFSRRRQCQRGSELQFIHLECVGPAEQVVNCEVDKCGEWSPWSPWELERTSVQLEKIELDNVTDDIYDYEPLDPEDDQVRQIPVYHYMRQRTCQNGTAGWPNCLGDDVEERVCIHGCPTWSPWSPWLPTDTDELRRTRECQNESEDLTCNGEKLEEMSCDGACPTWSEWQPWSSMTACTNEQSCSRERKRTCTSQSTPFDVLECPGSDKQEQNCLRDDQCAVWSDWKSAVDQLNRVVSQRSCLENNDQMCVPDQSKIVCDEHCPYWSDWSEWAPDAFSAFEGFLPTSKKEKRNRVCINQKSVPSKLIEHYCPGEGEEERETDAKPVEKSKCNQKHGCPYWSEWGEWVDVAPTDVLHQRGHITRDKIFEGSAIDDDLLDVLTFTEDEAIATFESATPDTQYRRRDCVNLVLQSRIVKMKELYCPGDEVELREHPDKYDEWAEWSFEPESSSMRRTRRCRSDLGMECPDLSEDKACDENCEQWTDWTETRRNSTHVNYARVCIDHQGIPTDRCEGEREKIEPLAPRQQRRLTSTISCMERCAKFGPWSTFEPDATSSKMTRKRQCLNNYECEVIDTVECRGGICVYFSAWTSWTLVEASRIDERHRECVNGQANASPHCQGKVVERRINVEPFWSEWNEGTPGCSATCGMGLRVYSRFCSVRDQCTSGSGSAIKLEPCQVDTVCPEWVAWEPWTSCSTTCGTGSRERIRECPMGGCDGDPVESEPCNGDKACPTWSVWSQPTACSRTCGGGIRLETRHCLNASNQHCAETFNSTTFIREEPCNTQKCPMWSEWGYYSECSKTCGNGVKQRKRHCLYGDECEGDSEQSTFCNGELCPYMSGWTMWSSCTVTCGEGLRVRHRQCVNGSDCEGDVTEAMACTANGGLCPIPGQWSEWGACSERCDGGIQSRSRPCLNGQPGELGCIAAFDETRVCNQRPCPFYTPWQSSSCSASCGGGFEAQSRSCANLATGLEDYCTEKTTRLVKCNEQLCPLWTAWSAYGECSRTCGVGKKTRSRTCQHGFVGQIGCDVGSTTDEATCNTEACPIWIDWSEWTECSATCAPQQTKDFPTQRRERGCIFGEVGEIGCEGEPQELRECNTEICPHWTAWKVTMPCSATCGGGVELKVRQCVNGIPGVTPECAGQAFSNDACNTQPCPYWSAWASVDKCSATCGGGVVNRERQCTNGEANVSAECMGTTTDIAKCNDHSCATWSDWSDFTECSAQCDTGTKSRYRECYHGNTGDDGCEGDAVELVSCSDALCKQWTQWTVWSACSVTCQRGRRSRSRECVGEIGSCQGEAKETGDCFEGDCPKWSDWKVASECPVTCGGGLQKLERQCFNGLIGQDGCIGSNEKVIDCNEDACPAWNQWAEWSECTATCGGGTRFTRRQCINGNKGQDGCKGDDLRFEPCANEPCVYWTQWGEWGNCESKCADTKCRSPAACALADQRERHYRYRNCINGQIDNGCAGQREESKKCVDLPECDQWANWGSWSDCSQTCRPLDGQAGSRSRSRACDSIIREEVSERLCPGDSTETQVCASYPCTSELVFDAVKEAICEPKYADQTCGQGFRRAQRDCTQDEIDSDECDESGKLVIVQDCDLGSCRSLRNRESSFIPTESKDFSTNFKNRFRNTEGPGISLKVASVCSRADVVLLLDGSSSMGTEKTKLSVEFAKKLTKRFKVGLDKFRIAIAKYDKGQELLMSLRDSVSNLDVLKKLDTIVYTNGAGTLTGRALEFVAKNVLNKFGYQGDRVTVPDVIVLVTDGKSYDDPEEISMRLHDRHIKIIVIGIGPKAYEPQLHRIASVPVDENTFKFDSYADLARDKNIRTIAAQVKQQCFMAKGWSKWGDWEPCSTTCGPGEKMRRRRCHHATEGSRGCPGGWKDVEVCNTEPVNQCDFISNDEQSKNSTSMASGKWVNGEWSEWTQVQLKVATTAAVLTTAPPTYRQWSTWSLWSTCSVTCGSGSQFRRRECDLDDDGVAKLDCTGKPEDIRVCQMGGCPYYTEWAAWSPCSTSCGAYSERTRVRECKNSFNGPCIGKSIERNNCGLGPCPHWAEWVEWDAIECSAACGGGSKTRERECINGEPNVDCRGIRQQIVDCTNGPCQTWSPWSRTTTACSVTCGIGTKTRSRTCQRGICLNGDCCLGEAIKEVPCRGPPCYTETTTPTTSTTVATPPEKLIFTNTSECELIDDRVNLQCLNSECEIMCESGYELVGATMMNCTDGKWSQSQPQCARQCSDDVDIILAIPLDINQEQSVYVRMLIKKIVTLFGGNSMAKFAALFVDTNDDVYWIWEFEDYVANDRLIELTDRIRPGASVIENKVPADLARFLFNMSGRGDSPNIIVNFDTVNVIDQDESFYTSHVSINEIITRTRAETDHELIYQLVDDMKFCTVLVERSMECLERSQIDLSFVIDSSSSIGTANFSSMKDFIIKIIKSFTVGPANTQVSLLRYNSDIEPVYWLDTFNTIDEIVTATAEMEYAGSGTSTGAALEYAAINLLNPDFGAREGATRMTIVLTDGASDDYIDQSAQLLQSRSNVIAIGVTNDSNLAELSRIASAPLSRSIYQVSKFNDLELVVDSVLDALCTVKHIFKSA